MKRRFLLMLVACCAASIVLAQEIRIGVVVDRTGSSASAAVEAAIAAFDIRMRSGGGVFGTPVDVLVRDGRGDPGATTEALEHLATVDEVHALVCCTDAATARVGAAVAEAHALPLLVLAPPGPEPGAWSFTLAPDPRTELRAIVGHAYAEGKRALGLMTLDHAFGDLPERILMEELAVADMELAVVERYPPNVGVLTPEALWVATRQPGAVVVWGLAQDTRLAVDALRSRGYAGPIYARSELIGEASARIDPSLFGGVRFAVAPILVDEASDQTPSLEAAARLADVLLGLYGIRDVSADAARAHDALELLLTAAEQAAVYGVPPADVAGYRVALRDAAIALPAFPGAAGIYDLPESGGQSLLPRGLAVVELRGTRWVSPSP